MKSMMIRWTMMDATHTSLFLAAALAASFCLATPAIPSGEAKLHKFSATIEKERPELNEETRRLIAAFVRDASEANRIALKRQVEKNYDAVLARKRAKLEELRQTARHANKVKEMQDIIDEMVTNRALRVEQTMRRFADPRFRPGLRDRKGGYLPVLGAGTNVSIAYAPVTNADYATFVAATGHAAPKGWVKGQVPEGKGTHPVTGVSYADAVAYARWRSKADGATYRLPTEEEWEYAAGHMPKDADFNCGERQGTSPVEAYAKTLSACGAIDMWGNCWEWTSTHLSVGAKTLRAVKGGAWDTPRTDCRTERKGEGRNPASAYPNVGFRLVRID